jgi:carboxyl-terminal processing protease
MKTKRFAFGVLILSLMACNFVTQMIVPPTATPLPTATFTPTSTLTPTPTQLAPAYIPPQCASSPLATLSPSAALEEPTLEAKTNPTVSKTEQIQIFRAMTDVVDRVYVYPDFNGKDWKAIKQKYQSEIEAGLDTEAFYQQMQAMISDLGDNHSAYLSPLDVQADDAELKGKNDYVGVGIYGDYDYAKNSFVVISTFPGSSAEHAGIEPHDSILLVDDLPITQELGNRLRGPECSVVMAKVQSPGQAPRDVMMMRYKIETSVPIDARLIPTTDGSRIGYIFIPSFFDETLPPQIKDALNKFGQLDGLILDLRLNGGGSSTVTYPILEFFTHGILGKFVSRTKSRQLDIQANPIQNSQTVPLIVLVSQGTVSFGEIFSGIMQDSGRAKVVGETSMGNVEILNGYDFEDGSLIWIAAEKFHSAFSNVDWEGRGVIPDVEAFAPWDTFNFDTDPSVKAAVQLLGHK